MRRVGFARGRSSEESRSPQLVQKVPVSANGIASAATQAGQ